MDFTIYASKIFRFKREGQFKEFAGQLSFDPENPLGTQVDLTVYTSSLDIHNDEHNQLLGSGAFFDVERFPTMHFTSSSTDAKPDGTFSVTGDLTIRGITQRKTIPVSSSWLRDRRSVERLPRKHLRDRPHGVRPHRNREHPRYQRFDLEGGADPYRDGDASEELSTQASARSAGDGKEPIYGVMIAVTVVR